MTEEQKNFLETVDFNSPDWKTLPADFFSADLENLSSNQVGKFLALKSLWELAQPQKIKQETRNWQDPKGYQYLALWQNAALLRLLVRKFTETLPYSEKRLKAQLDDAARSFKRNIEEGWKRPTTSEYLQFLGYSQASLEEVKGDIRDAKSDGFLRSVPGSLLLDIGIDLRVFKGPSKGFDKGSDLRAYKGPSKGLVNGEIGNNRESHPYSQPLKPLRALGEPSFAKATEGEPDEPGHPYCEPLKDLKGKDLTYEMFLELINKSDWLARKTVESLEGKLIKDKKYYEVQQARIRSNLRFR